MLLTHQVQLPDVFSGISSTAPLPAVTAAAIRQQYPAANLGNTPPPRSVVIAPALPLDALNKRIG